MRMAIGILNSIVSIARNTPPLSRGSTGDLSVGDGFGFDIDNFGGRYRLNIRKLPA